MERQVPRGRKESKAFKVTPGRRESLVILAARQGQQVRLGQMARQVPQALRGRLER